METVLGLSPKTIVKNFGSLLMTWKGPSYGLWSAERLAIASRRIKTYSLFSRQGGIEDCGLQWWVVGFVKTC